MHGHGLREVAPAEQGVTLCVSTPLTVAGFGSGAAGPDADRSVSRGPRS